MSEDSVMRLDSPVQQLCEVGSVEVDFRQQERSDLLPRLLAALHYYLHGSASHLAGPDRLLSPSSTASGWHQNALRWITG